MIIRDDKLVTMLLLKHCWLYSLIYFVYNKFRTYIIKNQQFLTKILSSLNLWTFIESILSLDL